MLDTDLGQKLVGPPACITLGRYGTVEGLDLTTLAFVGTTNPLRGWGRLLGGTRMLLAASCSRHRLIVNTSGLLAEAGRRLKAAKIAAIRPDLLIALGDGPDLEAILADHSDLPVLRLEPSLSARRKTDAERRAARRAGFAAYFAGCPEWQYPLRNLDIEGMRPAERSLVGLRPGQLCSLADAQGCDLALGIVTRTEADTPVQSATVEIRAPNVRGRVSRLRPGEIMLVDHHLFATSAPSGMEGGMEDHHS